VLRIDIQHGEEATSFTIAGKLSKPWVEELEKCWRSEMASDSARPVAVELSAVTYVDSTGKQLLTEMRRQGVTLVPSGCLMKAIVEEIEEEVRQQV
jgi:ABC-type transporter Mla MlaB component